MCIETYVNRNKREVSTLERVFVFSELSEIIIIISNKSMDNKSSEPKTLLEGCLHEFQEKVNRMKPAPIAPPPLAADSKHL